MLSDPYDILSKCKIGIFRTFRSNCKHPFRLASFDFKEILLVCDMYIILMKFEYGIVRKIKEKIK